MTRNIHNGKEILILSEQDSETLRTALEAEPQEPTAAFQKAVKLRKTLLETSREQDNQKT